MEPQTETTNSSEKNQAQPPKDSFRSVMTSPGFWLSIILPVLSLYVADIIDPDHYYSILPPLILPILTCFAVNILWPFTVNFQRATYLCLTFTVLFISWFIFFASQTPETSPGDNLLVVMPALMLIVVVVFFGWLGTVLRISFSRKMRT